ncbi:MAG TPA: hypothetical protein VGQ16_15840 [Vicinamibacterales bacterium]|jgi:hypothetical protein|nr:hypothetical protein [Vicinamibacterales bacterium]
MSVWLEGLRRVGRAPMILAGVWAMTVLVAMPLTLSLRDALTEHLGASLAADRAAGGVDYDWMQEFGDVATGPAVTFKPTILGFGAVLDNLSAFLDATTRPIAIVAVASAYVLLWIFLAGGILDRYARDRATRADGFFSVCGVFFFRFARLAAVQLIVYVFLFTSMHAWLFDRLYPNLIRDLTVERTAFLIRLALYVVFGVVLAGCNLLFDYAKVRAVIEDRRSVLGAIVAAARFIGRNYAAVVTFYLLNVALFVIVLAVYAAVAPGAGATGVSMWAGFLVSQVYIAARLWVKLAFWASEIALFQDRLAHAGYVARPEPVWPDSPAADAIREI